MFYATRIQKAGDGRILDEKGKELRTLGHMPVADGDVVFNDGQNIFGDTFEGTQLTSFKKPGIPVLGDEDLCGYFKRSGKYKEYQIAEGDCIVNDTKTYIHLDGANYLDAEFVGDGAECYTAQTTASQPYCATLRGGSADGDSIEASDNDLVINAVDSKGNQQEKCRVPLQDLFEEVLKSIEEATERYSESFYETYAEDESLQVSIAPDVSLAAKINNLKISPDKKVEMIYSTSGTGDIRFITNFKEVSNRTYTRKEFLATDFLMDHEEYGGDKHLKEALLTLWDFNLNFRDHDFWSQVGLATRVDIFEDSNNKVKITEIEVAEYKRENAIEGADDSDTAVYFELRHPVSTDYLIHATGTVENLFSNKTYLHRAQKTTGGFDKRKVTGKQLLSHVSVTNYMAKVACVDGLGTDDGLYPFDLPAIYSPFPSWPAALHVMIMPVLRRPLPYIDVGLDHDPGDHYENQEELETDDLKFAMQLWSPAATSETVDIGLVVPSEMERYQIYRTGTGFVFFHGNISTTSVKLAAQIFPLRDKIMYRIIVRANLVDGEAVEFPMVLSLSGTSGCRVSGNTTEEANNQSEFTFPVQDEYRAKYRRDDAESEAVVAEEKLWSITGIYESDTKICDAVPTQYDRQLEEIPSIDYNVSMSPLGKNAANGYLVGVNDGKLYRYNNEDGFEEVGSELKNFRLREMKKISKARK